MLDSQMGVVMKVTILIVIPYLLGLLLSPRVISADFFHRSSVGDGEIICEAGKHGLPKDSGTVHNINDDAEEDDYEILEDELSEDLYEFMMIEEKGDPFDGVRLMIHRNGEADPCGAHKSDPIKAIGSSMDHIEHNPSNFDKYDFDSVLTRALASSVLSSDSCGPTSGNKKNGLPELLNFCDMGEAHTVIQPDHDDIIPVKNPHGQDNLPCHFHTREGVRIASLNQLADLARGRKVGSCSPEQMENNGTCAASYKPELHIYAVPAGRVFMFAPKYVGEIFNLPHVEVDSGLPVWLKVISIEPRVFDVMNFFDREESAAIVKKALKETSETHRMKRSSTGASGYNVNNQRTSENGFDTHGKEAQKVKRRCLNVLGFDEYEESITDGLQVLRYNKTTAYIPHLDWIDDLSRREEHNFDSAGVGTNRFATILLYMSNLEKDDGGETVFEKGWPVGQPEEERKQLDESLRNLRESGDASILEEGSWEEKMVAKCRTRLAIQPNSARAVLFYSQHPDGHPDKSSSHGGCPVLNGEKWAANLWVWNGPRNGFPGSPVNEHVIKMKKDKGINEPSNAPRQLKVVFRNSGKDPRFEKADLYFMETFWGPLGYNDPDVYVNSFEGHIWNVKVGDKILQTWTIGSSESQQFSL